MNMMRTRFWALAVLLVLAISAMAGRAAQEKEDQQRYDYIIVGGGTAGCPLAATLSEGYSVAVLERGGNDEDVPSVVHERGFLANVNVNVNADADAEGPSEAFVSDDGVRNTRARVLGGGSSINAGFYTRADPHFLRHPALDLASDMAAVNASYRWVEDSIVFRPVPGPWQRAFLAALAQVGIRPSNGFSLDHVSGAKLGGSIFDPNGFRHSAAQLLRRHGRPDRVRVLLRSTVTRVLFQPSGRGPKAVGVEYLDRGRGRGRGRGRRRRMRRPRRRRRLMLRPRGEVVLSAGALGSPQLLMLSGVGPRAELERHGIEVVCDRPEVGQGMADNPQCGASVLSVAPLEFSLIEGVGITPEFYVEASSSGPLVMAGGLSLSAGSVLQKLARPASRGQLRLRSADVNVPPAVRFNYFADARDLRGCARGMRTVAEILRTPAMRRLAVTPVDPALPDPEAAPDEAFETVCRSRLSTLWHYHGGCVIGRVLDRAFRVRGVRALRVVDGSAFPASPGTNPQATVMMLGRYVGLRILNRRANRTSARSF